MFKPKTLFHLIVQMPISIDYVYTDCLMILGSNPEEVVKSMSKMVRVEILRMPSNTTKKAGV